jgi:DICT domain-containing protein
MLYLESSVMLEGSILQKLQDAHRRSQPGKRPLNFGVYYKNTLVALCHALEDAILASDCDPLVITAFQRGKWYLQEADRYADIAARSLQIVIMAADDAGFADHPTSQRENVNLVPLKAHDPVAQEWHLIIVSPHYTAMVLCQELSESDYRSRSVGLPQTDLERKFYGFWTFEPTLVMETAQLAIAHVGQYDVALAQRLAAQLEQIMAQSQGQDAFCTVPTADRLGSVASRVVGYLHDHHEHPEILQSHAVLDDNLLSNELQAFLRVAQLIDQTDLKNPMAGAEVATLAEAMGQLLDLPAWQIHRLRLAGLLHRIAFLQTSDYWMEKGIAPTSTDVTASVPLTCPLLPGTQVLRTMPRLRAIATIITHQTEWWNGQGQPAGLAGDAIPLESRILGLVAEFQYQVAIARQALAEPDSPELQDAVFSTAFSVCQTQQGDRWDPKLLDALALLVQGLRQGLSLPIAVPKIAAGMWLLDSHTDENLLHPAYESGMGG